MKMVYTCDHKHGCNAKAEAGSQELLTEWSKAGYRWGTGLHEYTELYFCGKHSGDAHAYDSNERYT
jgi:hypothetical protein